MQFNKLDVAALITYNLLALAVAAWLLIDAPPLLIGMAAGQSAGATASVYWFNR